MRAKGCGCRLRKRTQTSIGICFILTGIFLILYWPPAFDQIVNRELIITEKSKTFALWKDPTVSMFTEFYFFNWTNPQDFNNPKTKPILEELGPYVYRETVQKFIDDWHPENGTVTYRQKRTWFYEPSLSKGTEDDVITTVNIVAALAESATDNLDEFSKMLIDGAVQAMNTNTSMKIKVREILFDGYDDPLLNLASMIPGLEIPVTKFGYFHAKNGSAEADGTFNMKTGVKDLTELGQLAKWNYENKTSNFKSHCGAINGSAGELFPPRSLNKSHISAFSADICRSVRMPFETEVQREGIKAYRYSVGEELFAHQDSNPHNWCFCNSQDKGQCPPSGVLDLSACKWGAAAYLSFPHFYKAHSSYREALIGMQPDEAKHSTYVELEPNLGIPLQASIAFQINILVSEHEGFSLFEGVPKTYFPTMWFKQSMKMDKDLSSTLKLILIYLPQIFNILAYLCTAIGFLFIISALCSLYETQTGGVAYISVPEVTKSSDMA